jgi:hypothetical protein
MVAWDLRSVEGIESEIGTRIPKFCVEGQKRGHGKKVTKFCPVIRPEGDNWDHWEPKGKTIACVVFPSAYSFSSSVYLRKERCHDVKIDNA